MSNKEKFLVWFIVLFAAFMLYFAGKAARKIEVRFSSPVSPIGNSIELSHPDIWDKKQ